MLDVGDRALDLEGASGEESFLHERVEQRALAAADLADDHEELARREGKGEVGEDGIGRFLDPDLLGVGDGLGLVDLEPPAEGAVLELDSGSLAGREVGHAFAMELFHFENRT